ncbi:DUF6602 domain-containing protein [Nesterenkonia natronophila]|uniref:DUF6602 domain-containing protein n=1 Tax=Nesterenkonia natronophila TaxID=2174932 RepID=A0A3A4F221_9MICC|nr:DUF6602 domain-containing protein [Nesterenkonia natronophila]RJN31878.1 hypothetical protein D3250_07120 [Nesterenkonia natronophila]
MSRNDIEGLRATLRTTAESLRLELKNIRDNFDHNGIKGTSAEEKFHDFLRRHLPDSVGITSGEVVDVDGGRSGELDVILFDKPRTPMLFGEKGSRNHSVPVEGIIGVIEVKTRLKKHMVSDLIKSCQKVKTLQKKAFLPGGLVRKRERYGQTYTDMPVYYSVFAFESEGSYAGVFNDSQMEILPQERVDTVCYLDRGIGINATIDWETNQPHFSPWPTPNSIMGDTQDPERSLLHWFALLSTAVAQADTRPIDLTQYLGEDLQLAIHFPGGPAAQEFTEKGMKSIARKMGISEDILIRQSRGEPITLKEAVEVLRVNENYLAETDDMSEASRATLRLAKSIAKNDQRGASPSKSAHETS